MFEDARFSRYVQSLSRFGRLDHQTEQQLAERWVRNRDREAGRRLVETHLLFVVKVAHGFAGYGIPVADLVAEGNVGLLEALERFDPARNVRFISYAVWWIRAFILAYVQRHWSIVRLPSSSQRAKLFFRLTRARARVMSALGGSVSADEIEAMLSKSLQAPRATIREMTANLDQRDLSLDTPLFAEGPDTKIVGLVQGGDGQDDEMSRVERERIVRATVTAIEPALSTRERYIVRHRLLTDAPQTLIEIGRRFRVSRERVRQIELRLKGKLRQALAELAPDRRAA
jgi:RNA polymerase sigma-32 factor